MTPSDSDNRMSRSMRIRMHQRTWFAVACCVLLSGAAQPLCAQVVPAEISTAPGWAEDFPDGDMWLDRAHHNLHALVWRSARMIDGWFGPPHAAEEYYEASGSVAVAVLWNQFDKFQTRSRFRVNLPVPRLDERFHAFVGRVNRDEYVTERSAPSGAFPNDRGFSDEDETLAGLNFSEAPHRHGSFDASAGLRIRSPLDPYLKVGFRYNLGMRNGTEFNFKETVFWQNSEKFGATTRVEVERALTPNWYAKWTVSGTISQRTDGVRGYSTVRLTRSFSTRRAVIIEAGIDGESRAPVALHEFGLKVAYRRCILRNWLVLETRASVTWPKETPGMGRPPSWGIGMGVQMFFGTEEFSARPVTF